MRPTETYPLSLHDALPIYAVDSIAHRVQTTTKPNPKSPAANLLEGHACRVPFSCSGKPLASRGTQAASPTIDRKSTRLNSSHRCISYAVFCLKKKKHTHIK